jgi:Phage integrase, N-terminal SAM-like domain
MSVTMRPYRKRGKVSGWEADIRLSLPGLPEIRERRKAPGDYHSAMKWGQAIERWLIGYYTSRDPREGLTHDLSRMGKEDEDNQPEGPTGPRVPTFAEFWPRYMTGHCEANRLSPSTILQKRTYYKEHLGPAFGAKPLDQITAVDIETFKGARTKLMASTVNLGLKPCGRAQQGG